MSSPARPASWSSPSAAPAMTTNPPRAVILKGPSTNSKTYFIILPNTLEELIERAKELFPMPPDKTPLITLGSDERAILLQETMPFVRDREPLFFRWMAATPKRQLGNRVRWDGPSSVQFNASAPSSSIAAPSQASKAGGLDPFSSAPKPASSTTQVPTPPSATRTNKAATTRDPSIHFGAGVSARQAHVKRVLSEQKEKEARRQARLQSAQISAEPQPTADSAADPLETPTEESRDPISDATRTFAEATPETTLASTEHAEQHSPDALLLSPPRKRHPDNVALDTPPSSGSRSSSPFTSERKKAFEHKRVQHRQEEEQNSSPIQSPTRDLSAVRHKAGLCITDITDALTAGSELKRVTEQKREKVPTPTKAVAEVASVTATASEGQPLEDLADIQQAVQEEKAAVSDTGAKTATGALEEANMLTETDAAIAELPNVDNAQDSTPDPCQSTSAEAEKTYRYIDNLVNLLLSHGSNTHFREPAADTQLEASSSISAASRGVDLFTIRESIKNKSYGSAHISDSFKACRAVMLDFETDLSAMYGRARKLYGPKSAQAQCADALEKFSTSFIDEWKRSQEKKTLRDDATGAGGFGYAANDAESIKMAVLRQLTPTKRGEKRPAQLGAFPFAFGGTSQALFPGALGIQRKLNPSSAAGQSKANSSVKRLATADLPGQIRRNFSYDGQTTGLSSVGKKPSQSTSSNNEAAIPDGPFREIFAQHLAKPSPNKEVSAMTTSAAFERALRGSASSTSSTAPHASTAKQKVSNAVTAEAQEEVTAVEPVAEAARAPSPAATVDPTVPIAESASQVAMQQEEEVQAPTESEPVATVEEQDAAQAIHALEKQQDMEGEVSNSGFSAATLIAIAHAAWDSNTASNPASHEGSIEAPQSTEGPSARPSREASLEAMSSGSDRAQRARTARSPSESTATPSRGKKRGRPTRAETAAKLAAQAVAAFGAPQTPNSQRMSRSSYRLGSASVSPSKSATPTPARTFAIAPVDDAEVTEEQAEDRSNKRQRTRSASSSIATPPRRTVTAGKAKLKTSAQKRGDPNRAATLMDVVDPSGQMSKVATEAGANDEDDDDDDAPLRPQARSNVETPSVSTPRKRGRPPKVAKLLQERQTQGQVQQEEEVQDAEEVEMMFAVVAPSLEGGAKGKGKGKKRKMVSAKGEGGEGGEGPVPLPMRETRSSRRGNQ